MLVSSPGNGITQKMEIKKTATRKLILVAVRGKDNNYYIN